MKTSDDPLRDEQRNMNMITQALLLAGSMLVSNSAFAAPCGGFVDVDSSVYTGDFCTGVEWLRNRSVTHGCDAAGVSYCPEMYVSRIQMAAFMNRLGKALEPTFMYREETIPSGTALAGLPNVSVYCVRQYGVPTTGAGSFPRTASLGGWVLLHPSAAAHVIGAGAVYSTDGGGTWLGVGGGDYFAAAPTSAGEFRSIPVVSASQSVDIGQTVSFGIGIARVQGAGATMAATDCAMSLRIENLNSVTAPTPCDARPNVACGDSRDASLAGNVKGN